MGRTHIKLSVTSLAAALAVDATCVSRSVARAESRIGRDKALKDVDRIVSLIENRKYHACPLFLLIFRGGSKGYKKRNRKSPAPCHEMGSGHHCTPPLLGSILTFLWNTVARDNQLTGRWRMFRGLYQSNLFPALL